MLWDLMVTCTLFLFVLYLVFCCLVFLIYNFFFWEKGKTGLYLLGKDDEGFWCEFDWTAVDHLRRTHTLLTAPSQALWFAVLCVMCSIIPCNQRLAPSTSSHTRTSVPVNSWHFSVFVIMHHMVVKLLQALPPLPRTQQEVFSPLMLSIKCLIKCKFRMERSNSHDSSSKTCIWTDSYNNIIRSATCQYEVMLNLIVKVPLYPSDLSSWQLT